MSGNYGDRNYRKGQQRRPYSSLTKEAIQTSESRIGCK